jgi:hypothetical protein
LENLIHLLKPEHPAKRIAGDLLRTAVAGLRSSTPNAALAFIAGVDDIGYNTVRYGWVESYRGSGIITFPNGKQVRVTGYEPEGNAQFISKYGRIRFETVA